VAGWKAATTAIGWEVDAGSLVVIPKATIRAVEAREREHPTWGYTNRHFPLGADPRSPPAAALWGALRRVAPDYLLDLHSSRGIYGSGDGGVGQCAFHTPGVAEATTRAVAYLNREVVPADRPGYEFSPEPLRGRYEMLVWKAHVELDLPAVLFEVTEKGLAVETQVAWTTAFLRRLLAALGVRTTER
jgi:predicted deacylase